MLYYTLLVELVSEALLLNTPCESFISFFKAAANVFKNEDFPEPVSPIIMILMNGTSGVSG